MNKKPLFVASLETQAIARRLRDIKVGEEITYSELDQLIGRPCRQYGLDSARKELLRDRIVFDCISGEGLKRLNDSEIVKAGSTAIRRINRMAKRNIVKLAAADYDNLKADDKLRHNTSMTIYALAAASTGHESVKRIEHQVQGSNAALPAAKAALAAISGIK